MRPITWLLTIVLAVAALPVSAQESTSVSVCGTVHAYTAATASSDGSITIGSRAFVLRADELYSQIGQNRAFILVAHASCLQGTLDESGAFVQYLAIPLPAPYCGTVTAATAGSISLRDVGIAMFPVPGDVDLGSFALGDRICVILRLDERGDAVVASRSLTVAERAVARIRICGSVSAWSGPVAGPGATLVHEEAGSITVGSRTLAIAAGTSYSLVNAPPVVGDTTCLSGLLDADGALIEYAAQPGMPPTTCGRLAEHQAPTGTEDGFVRFLVTGGTIPFTEESHLFRIPAGTSLPADAFDGSYCFTLGLEPDGDAIVTGAVVPEPGGVSGPGAGTSRPSQLPSTSTSR
ncbi:MAG TPA: hypothetical protein VMJ92_05280 [Candidatus Limnocylindrales bacterium]|nr:hypothetical protein [Candidatus Limnocylindrales bacterium]